MEKHLEWIKKKTDEAKNVDGDVIPLLMEIDNTLSKLTESQLRDIILYLMGRINDAGE